MYTLLTNYAIAVEWLTTATAVLLIAFSLDDVAVDAAYWAWMTRRARRDQPDVNLSPEGKRLAIIVPAWQEHEVISNMLTTNRTLIEYSPYRFFVGAYRNDPATIGEVHRTIGLDRDSNIALVLLDKDGPTSKADCLNAIVEGVLDYERETGDAFDGFVLHDSEDVIHPKELSLFSDALDRHDFIQLPVLSFSRRLRDLVAGCYMDEFAEAHTKDLIVRHWLTGIVPCAGVAACMSRRAVVELRRASALGIFDARMQTEDYDLGLRIHFLGMAGTFLRYPHPVTLEVTRASDLDVLASRRVPIATREFFPSGFRAAYRQRARWLLGIAFQSWEKFGWCGGVATRFFFYRDRKAAFTPHLAMISYFCLLNIAGLELIAYMDPSDRNVPSSPLVMFEGEGQRLLISTVLCLLALRLAQRTVFTASIYGMEQGLMAPLRAVVSNFVNYYASVHALWTYTSHRLAGTSIAWEKTRHTFPERRQDSEEVSS